MTPTARIGSSRESSFRGPSVGLSANGQDGQSGTVRVRIQAVTPIATRSLKAQFIPSSGGDVVRTEGQTTIIADLPTDSLSTFRDFTGVVQSITELPQGDGGNGGADGEDGNVGNGGGNGSNRGRRIGGQGQQARVIPGVSNTTVVLGAASLVSVTLIAAAS